MFGSMQNWWEGAKKVVKGTEPDSDSEGTEGPDSNESSEKVLTPETENTPQVPSPTENLNKNTAEIGTGVTNTETSSVPKLGQPEKKENISSLLDDLENGNSMSANIQKDMEEVSTKAISTAKNWGSYLLGFGKASVSQVANTAKKLKDTVEEKTIIGEFNKEQEKFVTETKEKKNKTEASVPPWVGYNEEDTMKSQILALSQDKRNFLRNPPAGVQFNFDFTSSFPVAMSMLAEDPGLEKMRFELVPKQLKEETFWRNYFYRVSLIKQSAQLSSLAQQTGETSSTKSRDSSRRSSVDNGNSSGENKEDGTDSKDGPKRYQCYYCDRQFSDFHQLVPHLTEYHQAEHSELGLVIDPMEMVSKSKKSAPKEEDIPTGASPPDHEFISDAFMDSQINEDDLRKEMQQLGMSNSAGDEGNTGTREDATDDIPEWEKELQAELQEYEVVDDGSALDDADLEKEILQQIEAEANQS